MRLFKVLIMGLFKSLTGGDVLSAGSSLLGGVIGGISAAHAAKKQYQYQRKLNEQSQEFSEKNATTAYERQRELTQDNPLLQLQGMRNAGLSTSFSQGSTVAGASNVEQGATPSPGSAPSVASLAEGFNQGAQAAASIADLAVKKTQIANVKADTTGKEIDNTYKAAKAMADINETMARTKGYNFDNELKEMSNNIYRKFGERQAEAATAQAEADALIKGSAAFYSDALNEADLDKRKAEIDTLLSQKYVNDQTKKNLEGELSLLDEKREELRSRAYANYAVGADSYSHVEVNNTQSDVNREQKKLISADTVSVGLQNQITRATKNDVIKAAHLTVKEHGPQSISDYSWSVFNNWDKATSGQRWRACIGLPFAFLERAVGGAATGVAAGAGTNIGKKVTMKRPRLIKGFK